ncbi:chitin-binding type-2 domain-containing protein, partial [Trichonephila clavipes]
SRLIGRALCVLFRAYKDNFDLSTLSFRNSGRKTQGYNRKFFIIMRLLLASVVIVFAIGLANAEGRNKRQAAYAGYGGGSYDGGNQYRQPAPQNHREQAYQPQPQPQGYGGGQQVQHYPAQQARPSRQHGGAAAPEEEEKEQGPHPLQLLLEKSKFDCGGKSDGYYADSDVGCQAFHYCVTGQKHSMMCPAGTVFHQVHLNCVPADQDICSKADKFYFVNNYLNKPLEQKGPNNTVQYHQRYYPEGYAVGDPFIPPQEAKRDQREPPAATYGLGPAYREQSPQPAAYQPAAYQPAAPAHRPQPAAHRPAQPAPYAPAPQAYAPQQRPTYQAQPAPRPQAAQPVAYGYGAQQQQAYQAQAAQAQRAYNQQQYQAAAPQQHQYAQQAPRQHYA